MWPAIIAGGAALASYLGSTASSPQEDAMAQMLKDSRSLSGKIGEDKTWDIFDNYKPTYGINEQRTALDNVYDAQGNMIKRTAETAAADSVNRTNQSMASRGITGGSVMDDANAKSSNDIYAGLFDALEKLGIGRADAEVGLIDNANKWDFMGKSAELGATKDKYSSMSSALSGQGAAAAGQSNGTWMDDFGALLNAGSNMYSAYNQGQQNG